MVAFPSNKEKKKQKSRVTITQHTEKTFYILRIYGWAAMGWAIALHGGAGDIQKSLPPERREPREAALRHCLEIGVAALKAHKSPLDVVELVVRMYIYAFLCILMDTFYC